MDFEEFGRNWARYFFMITLASARCAVEHPYRAGMGQNPQLEAEVSFLSVRAMVKHHFQQVGHVPGSDGVVTHSSCRTHHFLHQLNL